MPHSTDPIQAEPGPPASSEHQEPAASVPSVLSEHREVAASVPPVTPEYRGPDQPDLSALPEHHDSESTVQAQSDFVVCVDVVSDESLSQVS